MKGARSGTGGMRGDALAGLLKFLGLDRCRAPYRVINTHAFPFRVPLNFAERMRKRDWRDPLLLQVLPRAEEAEERRGGFSDDPVGDAASQAAPGLLHKYASRVLLMASDSCAMHCRFCFRRCRPRRTAGRAAEGAFRYIARHAGLKEVILSGGDPLCLGHAALEELTRRIAAVPHITTVRIHTRAPVADPAMVTPEVLDSISLLSSVKNCVVVVHVNHANELAGDCPQALVRLRTAGAVLLNQSVLLRDINDSAGALCELSAALLDCGILPYYLHQLDRVRGAWHFEVAEEKGKMLMREMRERLPGYAVPRYVREVPGEESKRNIF
jgi:EF-P beta-lysylation protein EpmB